MFSRTKNRCAKVENQNIILCSSYIKIIFYPPVANAQNKLKMIAIFIFALVAFYTPATFCLSRFGDSYSLWFILDFFRCGFFFFYGFTDENHKQTLKYRRPNKISVLFSFRFKYSFILCFLVLIFITQLKNVKVSERIKKTHVFAAQFLLQSQ